MIKRTMRCFSIILHEVLISFCVIFISIMYKHREDFDWEDYDYLLKDSLLIAKLKGTSK